MAARRDTAAAGRARQAGRGRRRHREADHRTGRRAHPGRASRRARVTISVAMAYDEDLANRIRELVADEPGVTEQRMFGGLAFLVGGNMAIAASGQGGLMVRVEPEETDTLLAKPHA